MGVRGALYFLSGVDVLAEKSAGLWFTLGDSITDGSKSTTNTNIAGR